MKSEDSFERVKDLVTREEFREKISREIDKFGGLLTEEVAALLVVEQLGRYEVAYDRISDIRPDQPVRVRGEVVRISPVKEFQRRDDTVGSVANVTVSDGSGECRLVLWDDDTTFISKGALKVGGTRIASSILRPVARLTSSRFCLTCRSISVM